jgi:hypothetical protein
MSGGSPEGSISWMSDMASRLSAFESRFDSVTQSFSLALKLLQDQSAQQAQAQKEQFALMTQLLQCVMPAPALQSSAPQPTSSRVDNDPVDSELAEPMENKVPSASSSPLLTPPAAFTFSEAATEGIQLNASSGMANQPTQESITGSYPRAGGTAGSG